MCCCFHLVTRTLIPFRGVKYLKKMTLQQTLGTIFLLQTLDAFISYRRSNGSEFASLVERWLKERNLKVFIDVEDLQAGRFEEVIVKSIQQSRNFLLILTPGALDRCIGDEGCKDWLHKEILAALKCKCVIIPILHPEFRWPEEEKLPKDMHELYSYEAITWDHNFEEAVVNKLEKFIREAALRPRL